MRASTNFGSASTAAMKCWSASLMAAINFIATIIDLRCQGMSLMRLPALSPGVQLYCKPPTRTMSPPCW